MGETRESPTSYRLELEVIKNGCKEGGRTPSREVLHKTEKGRIQSKGRPKKLSWKK